MQYAHAFRRADSRVVLVIALLLGGYYFCHTSINSFFNNDDVVITRQLTVSKLVNLYIAETSAGATTPMVYYFYLIGADADAKRLIAEDTDRQKSFLSTSDRNVVVEIINTDLFLKVSGDIYQFDNRGMFKYKDNLYGVRVFLESRPK
ncbi:hypothetical protein [Ewingella allii]|uniref:hypothetical protein n=1 Tax=Ewingella allii TaxID=3092550 RepID=UPI0037BB64C6